MKLTKLTKLPISTKYVNWSTKNRHNRHNKRNLVYLCTRLHLTNMFSQISHKSGVDIRTDNKFTSRFATNKAMSQNNFHLRNIDFRTSRSRSGSNHLSAVNLQPNGPVKMFFQIAVKRRLNLFFGHRQNVIQNGFPCIAVQGRPVNWENWGLGAKIQTFDHKEGVDLLER